MTDLEIIARQAAEIYELRDKLAETQEVRDHWFNEAHRSIPVHRLSPLEEHNLILDLIKMGAKI